jgi:hypothetical protein
MLGMDLEIMNHVPVSSCVTVTSMHCHIRNCPTVLVPASIKVTDPNVYVPTDEPQPISNFKTAAANHQLDYQNNRPPPREFEVTKKHRVRRTDRWPYDVDNMDTGRSKNSRGNWFHPFALAAWP